MIHRRPFRLDANQGPPTAGKKLKTDPTVRPCGNTFLWPQLVPAEKKYANCSIVNEM